MGRIGVSCQDVACKHCSRGRFNAAGEIYARELYVGKDDPEETRLGKKALSEAGASGLRGLDGSENRTGNRPRSRACKEVHDQADVKDPVPQAGDARNAYRRRNDVPATRLYLIGETARHPSVAIL